MDPVTHQQVIPATANKSRFGYHPCSYEVYAELKELNHLWEKTRRRAASLTRWNRKTKYQGVLRERVFQDGKPTGWKTVGNIARPTLPEGVTVTMVDRMVYKWRTPEWVAEHMMFGQANAEVSAEWLSQRGFARKDANGSLITDPQGRFAVQSSSVKKPSIGGEWIGELYSSARRPQEAAPAPLDASRLDSARKLLNTLRTFYGELNLKK